MNGQTAILVRDLRVRRGQREVIHGLSVTIPTGTLTGLLGPSGCGKTTLIRSIAGVQAHVTGSVEVLGERAGSPALRHQVGYVTQAASVYPDLTIRQNLQYFADLAGSDRGAVNEALAVVDLGDHAGNLVGALSGGQRARASLAAALVGRPQIYLLDEPTVGLDPVLRADLWSLFHEMAATGITLLVSSHVMDEATRCERVLLMREGVLVADNTPGGLLADTGEADMEAAFLQLARRQGEEARS